MRGLALLVVGERERHRGQPVEADLAVRARIADRRHHILPRDLVVIGMVVEGPRRAAAKEIRVERRIGEAGPHAEPEAWSDVAHAVELVPDPAALDPGTHAGA